MKIIKLENLSPGEVTTTEYYSENGEILLAKDVTITQSHIDILKRRNLQELFTKEETEMEEIQKLLAVEFETLGKIELYGSESDDEEKLFDNETNQNPKTSPLKSIKPGLEGLQQLKRSKKVLTLDNKIKEGHIYHLPVGPPLKNRAKQIAPSDRSFEYKYHVTNCYETAHKKVTSMLNAIVNSEKIDSSDILEIVKGFVKYFVTDRNILLNLSFSRSRDEIYVYTHTLNVCLLTINLGASLGYNETQVIELGAGALLHDVGMLLVPKRIFLKKGKLTKDEVYEVHKHPLLGLHLLENISRLPESIPFIAYQSHEREDGKGYPKGRGKNLIHNFSKVVQIADIFVALCSPRPYRNAYVPYKAMETIIKMSRLGMIPGEYIKALLMYTSLFPVGSLVELNDHSIAKVIHANGTSFAKPKVSILTKGNGALLPKQDIYQVNLAENSDKHIIRALKLDYLTDINIMDGF